jgi:hypothetical protein
MQIELDRNPHTIIHNTPFAHWCAGCWDWVVDCEHLVDALPGRPCPATDPWIRTYAYDSRHGVLQVGFTWNEVRQFRPVAPAVFRQLLDAECMRDFLSRRILNTRWIRSRRVRTEPTVAFVLAMAAEMVLSRIA